jgi:hypothetical protein
MYDPKLVRHEYQKYMAWWGMPSAANYNPRPMSQPRPSIWNLQRASDGYQIARAWHGQAQRTQRILRRGK